MLWAPVGFSLICAAFFLFFTHRLAAQTVQGSIQSTSDANSVLVVAKPSTNLTNVRFSGFSLAISIPHQTITPTAIIASNSLPHLNWSQITDLNYNGRDYYIFLGNIDINNNTTVTWSSAQDNPVLNIQFSNGVGSEIVQLNDLTADGGGSTFQAYWYVELLGPGDITNYAAPFYASTGSGAATNNAGVNSFVPTSSSIALPLQLIDFKAEKREDKWVHLYWSTVNEIRFSHFDLEKSPDGLSWATIGSATAKSRLSISPNPTDGLVKLTWNTGKIEAQREVQLFDSTRRLLLASTTESNTISIDLSSRAAGIYWLRIITGT